jgi:hypothetical protein
MICGEAGGSPVRIASPNSIRDEERNVHELYSYEHNAVGFVAIVLCT